MTCEICGARCRCRNCHRHKPTSRLIHATALALTYHSIQGANMANPDLILLCGHHSTYVCIECGRCSNCCTCQSRPVGGSEKLAMPPLKSTLSLEAQDRLRELRRVAHEKGGA